ncbi:hypothetical protein F5148DRAFT_1355962 [Russula earlei]|uniref:Uncharacterized protein n=1 Tax=Russula earlei TaxID=71964 RepID=A0ACC0UAV1_9AGAM|nr:hypothetical protein F5148DRAFT_1355962 [Russula earlei]
MALQQASKATLVPGQTISVNKYTVQVERYLSQGGFAHVYLVRTPAAVYGTTHHVLKRIAVPNESMLTEVKKEVDIMRILKGHPNIVHLIDAAWNRTPTGVYEVFILMEYCPGGGIIDMMNRRLRERLTEADILQIFVDVCEGVASMHNLRPALLHRDLKVENILQSSDTLYKLCDFGSAAPVVARLPANTQEIRALEADLNRHTTLQYRAPEMVDPYLRRPIDEKSDVWALGVLLYKLCYYTTPFEEHGPLAILNVQYKIPPYPVYSTHMNSLIASMLREHGSQRPTVFEILNTVHRIRGTKSKFTYNVPPRSQLVPQSVPERVPAVSSALDGFVSSRSSTSSIPQPQVPSSTNHHDKNAGIQAREKVLEAIAPLRRGRPSVSLHHAITGPSSPSQEKVERKSTELEFKDAEDNSWKAARGAVRGHRSGLASPTAWPPPTAKNRDRRKTVLGGFGDSFEVGQALSSTVAAATSTSRLTPQSSTKPLDAPQRPLETTSRIRPPNKPKDAFEGLGLLSDRVPAPTLGEAQKARTGPSTVATVAGSSSLNLAVPGRGTSHKSATSSPRPSPSPRLLPLAPSPVQPISASWRPLPSPVAQTPVSAPKVDLTAEQRFPALEDFDSALLSLTTRPSPRTTTRPLSHEKIISLGASPVLPPQPLSHAFTSTGGQRSGSSFTQTPIRGGGIHSEQTTGATPLESRDGRTPKHERTGSHLPAPSPSRIPRLPSRALPPKRHTSLTVRPPSTPQELKPKEPPSPAQIMGRPEPQDWLTGREVDSITGVTTKAVLKESPGKRTSVIERAPQIPSPQEAVAVSEMRTSPPPSPTPAPRTTPTWIMTMKQVNTDTGSSRPLVQPKPGLSSVKSQVSAPPPADSWLPTHKRRDTTSTTSSDDGPEEATGYGRPQFTATRLPMQVEAKETGGISAGGRRRSGSKGRQSSVHELVDLWGGKEGRSKSSGGDNGPSAGPKPRSHESEDLGSKPLLFPPPGPLSKTRSASPSLISPSISSDSTRHEPSSTRTSPRHRRESINGRDAASPSASTGIVTARPRPQVDVPQLADHRGGEVPSARATRRTSISDMVQRYEAMGGSAGPSPVAPRPPTSSTPTRASLSRSATTHVSPPSRHSHVAAVGLPGLSTDPLKKAPTGIGAPDRPRPEPASPVGLPGLAMERKASASYGGRRSPIKFDATSGGGLVPASPISRRSVSPVPPAVSDEPPVSSPERPYQGVGRLIDEWQRKTADAEAPRSPVSRRRGGGTGTGATASPRRAGVIAGRGAHD